MGGEELSLWPIWCCCFYSIRIVYAIYENLLAGRVFGFMLEFWEFEAFWIYGCWFSGILWGLGGPGIVLGLGFGFGLEGCSGPMYLMYNARIISISSWSGSWFLKISNIFSRLSVTWWTNSYLSSYTGKDYVILMVSLDSMELLISYF